MHRFFALTALLLLAGCKEPLQNPNPTFPPQPVGGWFVIPQAEDCEALYYTNNHRLVTDGRFGGQRLYMKLITPQPLAKPPEIGLTSAPSAQVTAYGAARHWGFDVPYTPLAVSHMLHPNSALTFVTQSVGADATQTVIVPTAGLPETVAELAQNCN